MVRETSRECFHDIVNSGLISKIRLETYTLLFENGPMTANQLMRVAREQSPNKSHQSIESIGRRLSELRDQGIAEERGTVVCPETNRRCILWAALTDKMPVKFEKSKKTRCPHCDGKGYTLEQQSKFNI